MPARLPGHCGAAAGSGDSFWSTAGWVPIFLVHTVVTNRYTFRSSRSLSHQGGASMGNGLVVSTYPAAVVAA